MPVVAVYFPSMRALALIAAVTAAGCAEDVADPISGEVDFGDPKSVLGSVFYAARSGDTEHLGSLCDPRGEGNHAVERICAVTPRSSDYEPFRSLFRRGRLNGEPRISGDTAVIKFLYGPGGNDREVMTLVRRGGRWYLQSF